MRISREQMFMDIAEIVAKRSTCLRNNVGAIIVSDFTNNIQSIGYNGLPTKQPHCTLSSCCGKGCSLVIHAEANAIERATLLDRIPYSLYVTVSPCINCAKKIIQSRRIKKVYYRYQYRDNSGIIELIENNIQVYKILPSGEIIEETTEWKGK